MHDGNHFMVLYNHSELKIISEYTAWDSSLRGIDNNSWRPHHYCQVRNRNPILKILRFFEYCQTRASDSLAGPFLIPQSPKALRHTDYSIISVWIECSDRTLQYGFTSLPLFLLLCTYTKPFLSSGWIAVKWVPLRINGKPVAHEGENQDGLAYDF